MHLKACLMEADWEIEIGPGAPIIDASWAGFVELRREPALALQLPEAAILPGLAEALVKLNSSRQIQMWTAKCDVWQVADADAIDPYELDATPAEAAFAWACYIDLLSVSDQQWGHIRDPKTGTPTAAIAWCQFVCKQLHSNPIRCCRADLVIRKAAIDSETMDIGITAYLAACGPTSKEARTRLGSTLSRFVDGIEPPAKVEWD
jgi:hypothetical protein